LAQNYAYPVIPHTWKPGIDATVTLHVLVGRLAQCYEASVRYCNVYMLNSNKGSHWIASSE